MKTAAIAHPNIAFIKYWGNRDTELRIPENGSISMNLGGLSTRTSVAFDSELQADGFSLNGILQSGDALLRVTHFLDIVRKMAHSTNHARVESLNDFPTGAGIASSASAFAALALAATTSLGLNLNEASLSCLARRGSGSACRSIPSGFTEWLPGTTEDGSYAFSLAGQEYWALTDCIAVVHAGEKEAGSTEGHALAHTSPLQTARVADSDRRLAICRDAVLNRDFQKLADIIELDSNLLHAVMMSSAPPLYYWRGATIEVMNAVRSWRKIGIPCAFTIDAGPNVHVICPSEAASQVQVRLREVPGVESVLISATGGAARLLSD
jgi:diphosphomevalonate decarboxylase